MIEGGFYIKARAIQNSNISYAPPHIREIWDWLIKEANYKDAPTHGVIIKRGQCFTSYQEILDGLSWMVGARKMRYTKSQCETAMKYLTKHGMVTTARTTRGLIVTICKYDTYQVIENYETYTETGSKSFRNLSASESISKEGIKKERKKKKDITVASLSVQQSGELFNSIKALFLKKYAIDYKTEYYFQAKDAAKIYEIIKKVYFKMQEKDGRDEFTKEEVENATTIFLIATFEMKDNWISTNFNLSNIDSKFNDIFSQLKNKNNGTKIIRGNSGTNTYNTAKSAFGVK